MAEEQFFEALRFRMTGGYRQIRPQFLPRISLATRYNVTRAHSDQSEESMNRRQFIQAMTGSVMTSTFVHKVIGLNFTVQQSTAISDSMTSAEFHATRRFAATKYGRIAYIERGKGPAALFLHGFPLNSFQWRGIFNPLGAHRRCIAPDFLGLGYTEVRGRQSVGPRAQVAMITALLNALSVSSVDVVANDSGGGVAQLLVTQHPDRVRTLLLTNCDTEPDSPPPAVLPVIAMAREGTFADKWLATWLEDKGLARSAAGIGGMCYADPAHPTDEAIECYFSPLVSSPQRKSQVNAYAIALDSNPLRGIERALKRCRVPVRIVWGTADTIFSQRSAEYLDHTFANSRGVRRVTGAKLFFPEELPELIAEEALALWSVGAH